MVQDQLYVPDYPYRKERQSRRITDHAVHPKMRYKRDYAWQRSPYFYSSNDYKKKKYHPYLDFISVYSRILDS